MTIHNSALEAQVAAYNRLHAEINRLVPLIQSAITPFIGQKVELQTGGWSKKFKLALPTLPGYGTTGARDISLSLRSSHGYSMILEGWAEEPYTGLRSDRRSQVSTYIAYLNGGGLGEFYQFKPLRTDYTAEEVAALRKAVEDAERALSRANSALHPFGKY